MPAFRLKYTSEAEEDISNATDYYNAQLPGLGKIFKNEIKRQLALLKQNPYTRSVRYDNIRFALTNKFPYSIHYEIIDNKIIMIYAVLCDHKNPIEHWKR